jgi:hypothetical protein
MEAFGFVFHLLPYLHLFCFESFISTFVRLLYIC